MTEKNPQSTKTSNKTLSNWSYINCGDERRHKKNPFVALKFPDNFPEYMKQERQQMAKEGQKMVKVMRRKPTRYIGKKWTTLKVDQGTREIADVKKRLAKIEFPDSESDNGTTYSKQSSVKRNFFPGGVDKGLVVEKQLKQLDNLEFSEKFLNQLDLQEEPLIKKD